MLTGTRITKNFLCVLQKKTITKYTIVDNLTKAKIVANLLKNEKLKNRYFAVDTETIGVDPSWQSPINNAHLMCATIYGGPDLDFGGGPHIWIENCDEQLILEFKNFLEDREYKKVFHNYNFDHHVLNNVGIKVGGFSADTMHMARLLDSDRLRYSLEALSSDFLSRKKVSFKKLFLEPMRKEIQSTKNLPSWKQVVTTYMRKHGFHRIPPDFDVASLLLDGIDGVEGMGERNSDVDSNINLGGEILSKEVAEMEMDDSQLRPYGDETAQTDRSTPASTDLKTTPSGEVATPLSSKQEMSKKEDGAKCNEDDTKEEDGLTGFGLEGKGLDVNEEDGEENEGSEKKAGKQTRTERIKDKGEYLPDILTIQKSEKTREIWIDYCVYDSEATWLLRETLEKGLRAMAWAGGKSMMDFYTQYYVPFSELLVQMESNGFLIDKAQLQKSAARAYDEILKPMQEFKRWASRYEENWDLMNPNSTRQLQQLLFAPSERGDVFKSGMQRAHTFKCANKKRVVLPGRKRANKNISFEIWGLGIKPIQRTKSGTPQCNEEVLEKLSGNPFGDPPVYGLVMGHFPTKEEGHEACKAIYKLRQGQKVESLLTTFIEPLINFADKDNVIHTSLNLNTNTGRISSRCPNLQSQPSAEKDIYKIRQAFKSRPGNKLIVADYGQLELRVLAHTANCSSMIDAFKSGGDFHSRTAMQMFPYITQAVKEGKVLMEDDLPSSKNTDQNAPEIFEINTKNTKNTNLAKSNLKTAKNGEKIPKLKEFYNSERQKAKIFNFSIVYGKTSYGFAKDFGMTKAEATKYLDAWYKERPEVKNWHRKVILNARKTGYTRTLMGRYRNVRDINSPESSLRSHAERIAINTPIQGGAADIVMMAMLNIYKNRRLNELGWKLILQVHDEVIIEGPEESVEEALHITKSCLERPFENELKVALVVNMKVAGNWYDGK